MKAHVAAVLFDLDGTLIDSAPDLAGAANEMRVARGLATLPHDALRPFAGRSRWQDKQRRASGPKRKAPP